MTVPLLPGLSRSTGARRPTKLCQFHLPREYQRKAGCQGFRAAIIRSGEALEWCRKALGKGTTHLRMGQERHRTTSRLERQNREHRRQEKMGTVWSPHNLLALLQVRGLINQTP